MAWKKQGVIFEPAGQAGWMNSHAQVPTPLVTDSAVRVYFCTRPEPGISLTTFLDLEVVETARGLTMFYNGNGFGTSGIGYALWQDDEGLGPCASRAGR